MRYLKQNTDQYVTVGPLIDKTDGFTTKDDATVTNLTYLLSISTHAGASTHVTGTCSATAANDYGCAAIGHNGMYDIKLADADLNFVGSCTLALTYPTAYLPVWHEFMVVPANVWDSLMGTDLLDVSTVQWAGTAVHATTIAGVPIVQQHTTGGGVDGPTTSYPANFEHLSITDNTGLVAVPDTQKVDVNTIKTQAVTCGAGVTVRADVGAAAAPGAGNGMLIGGSNAAATFANLTVSGTSALGAVTATTIGASGAVTAASLTMSGALQAATIVSTGTTTLNALAVTNNASVGGTTSLTGNVRNFGTTTYSGAVTFSDAITATAGPVSMTNASNDIKGVFIATNGITAAAIATGAIDADAIADNAIDAGAIAADAITAAKIAAGAIDAATFAADVDAEAASWIWGADATSQQTQGTFGQAIGDPVADANTIYKATVTDAGLATVGLDVVEVLTRVPDATAGAAGGLFIAGANAATSVTTALTANIIGNVTGTISDSAGVTELLTRVADAPAGAAPTLALTTGHAHAGGTASSFGTSLTNADNVWNDALILFTSGDLAGQVKEIADFANTDGVITLTSGQAFTAAPAVNDTFAIINR